MSALFPDLPAAAAYLKANILPAIVGSKAAAGMDPVYVSDKLASAEAEAARDLRVLFGATKVFAGDPTDAEIAGLAGAAYIVEPAYDYAWEDWQSEAWGMLAMRRAPMISVESMEIKYPYPGAASFPVPVAWIKVDRKFGHVRVVPGGAMPAFVPYFSSLLAASGRRVMPQCLVLRYTAGLENVVRDYPDIVDLVRKMAVLKVVDDRMIAGTTSTSVDGLSESKTVDFDKYREALESKKKALFRALHGAQLFVA